MKNYKAKVKFLETIGTIEFKAETHHEAGLILSNMVKVISLNITSINITSDINEKENEKTLIDAISLMNKVHENIFKECIIIDENKIQN